MTKQEIIKFYINNNPYFTNVEKEVDCFFCTNKYGKDIDCNCAFLLGNETNLEKVEKKFLEIEKVPVVYNIKAQLFDKSEKLKDYTISHSDAWLIADVDKLCKRFSLLRCPSSVGLEKVTTKNYEEVKKVSRAGFSSQTSDNPYFNVELFEYHKALFDKLQNAENDELNIFLIKYKDKNVGSININISGHACYISGFTILPEYRRTHVFFALNKILTFLKGVGITKILCLTDDDGYPKRLYRKLGFEEIFTADILVKKKNTQ